MAGQFLSLGEVKQAALYRGDLEGLFDRHPTLNLNQEANLSYRDLRMKLANNDVRLAMSPTAILNLPVVEAVTGGGYAELDWPTTFTSVHGLDVRIGGDWSTIKQGAFVSRRIQDTDRDWAFNEGGPARWIERTLPTVSGSTPSPGKIMLFPVPTVGQYVLWGLDAWNDISLDTDLFTGMESWLQWVIWDLACKCLIRDIGPQTSAQLEKCELARERIWAEIKPSTQRLAQDAPIQPPSRYGSGRGSYRMVP